MSTITEASELILEESSEVDMMVVSEYAFTMCLIVRIHLSNVNSSVPSNFYCRICHEKVMNAFTLDFAVV